MDGGAGWRKRGAGIPLDAQSGDGVRVGETGKRLPGGGGSAEDAELTIIVIVDIIYEKS